MLTKPKNESSPEREAELEKLPQQIASEQEWEIYRMRNDSLIVDYFQGQFRNRMECLTCHHVSDNRGPRLLELYRADEFHVSDFNDLQFIHVFDLADTQHQGSVKGFLVFMFRHVRQGGGT